ncbi:MAG: DUF459 domain-containing protein [Candidatus Accumulibacter sp.]|jgi:hypothetical protein|nr:DUF459 domain-containing protein [Accumulibacter sp.]
MSRTATQTLCTLLVTLALLTCLEQDAITRYWRQVHHEDAPIDVLKFIPAWASGARLNDAMNAAKLRVFDTLARFDVATVASFNAERFAADDARGVMKAESAEGLASVENDGGGVDNRENAGPPQRLAMLAPSLPPDVPPPAPLVPPTPPTLPTPPTPPTPKSAPKRSSVASATAPTTPTTLSAPLTPPAPPVPPAFAPEDDDSGAETDAELPKARVSLDAANRVLFVGDSLMQGVAPHVHTSLFKRFAIHGIDLSKQSTGLAYPDFFNWPRQIKKALHENPEIKLMVVFLGPNDPWDFPHERGKPYLKFKSEVWESAYRARIREVLEIARENGTRVFWLEVPCMRRRELDARMVYLNGLFSDEVKKSGEFFLTTGKILGCDNGQFSSFMDSNGKRKKSRIDDGVHFTIAGQRKIADEILSFIHADPRARVSPRRRPLAHDVPALNRDAPTLPEDARKPGFKPESAAR